MGVILTGQIIDTIGTDLTAEAGTDTEAGAGADKEAVIVITVEVVVTIAKVATAEDVETRKASVSDQKAAKEDSIKGVGVRTIDRIGEDIVEVHHRILHIPDQNLGTETKRNYFTVIQVYFCCKL